MGGLPRHPFEAGYSDWDDTGISDGLDDLIDLYGISLYGFGHTHDYRENYWSKDVVNNVFYMNVDSIDKKLKLL